MLLNFHFLQESMLLNFHFLQESMLLNQDSQKYAQGSDQGPRLQQRGRASQNSGPGLPRGSSLGQVLLQGCHYRSPGREPSQPGGGRRAPADALQFSARSPRSLSSTAPSSSPSPPSPSSPYL